MKIGDITIVFWFHGKLFANKSWTRGENKWFDFCNYGLHFTCSAKKQRKYSCRFIALLWFIWVDIPKGGCK